MIFNIKHQKQHNMKKRFLDNNWVQIGVKLSPEEKLLLIRKAHEHEMNVSEYVRSKTL